MRKLTVVLIFFIVFLSIFSLNCSNEDYPNEEVYPDFSSDPPDLSEAEELTEEEKNERKYQMGISAIERGNWDAVTLNLISLDLKNYKDTRVLYNYASAEKEKLEGDFGMMMYYLDSIPDDYQGDLAEIILSRKEEIFKNKDELEKEMRIIEKEREEQEEKERKEREAQAALRAKERLRDEAILERISFKWYQSSRSYVTAEGEVKNISGVPLRNVMAVITYRTKEGDFITYDRALIEYNPIMPDQKSPFKVITPYNPLMDRTKTYLEFQFHSGEKIPHYFE